MSSRFPSHPCNLLITGPARSGKSTLVKAWAQSLESQGVKVEWLESDRALSQAVNELAERTLTSKREARQPIVFIADREDLNLRSLENLIHQGRQYDLYKIRA